MCRSWYLHTPHTLTPSHHHTITLYRKDLSMIFCIIMHPHVHSPSHTITLSPSHSPLTHPHTPPHILPLTPGERSIGEPYIWWYLGADASGRGLYNHQTDVWHMSECKSGNVWCHSQALLCFVACHMKFAQNFILHIGYSFSYRYASLLGPPTGRESSEVKKQNKIYFLILMIILGDNHLLCLVWRCVWLQGMGGLAALVFIDGPVHWGIWLKLVTSQSSHVVQHRIV